MSEPTKPGYYWAKWKGEDELLVICITTHGVWAMAYQKLYNQEDFDIGPEITKPEVLE